MLRFEQKKKHRHRKTSLGRTTKQTSTIEDTAPIPENMKKQSALRSFPDALCPATSADNLS